MRRYWLVALVAVLGIVVAFGWGILATLSWIDDLDAFPSTDIPGEVVVGVDEPGTQVVYYERETWVAVTPLDPDIEVVVQDPGGSAVDVNERDPFFSYRWFGRVIQEHADFNAAEPGDYVVTASGAPGADGSIAVGHDTSLLRDMIGPLAVLVVSLVAAVAIALTTRRRGA